MQRGARPMRVTRIGFLVSALLVTAASVASAQDAVAAPAFGEHFFWGIVGAVVYSILGIVILLVGFKIFDIATPFDLNKEIAEDNNAAAGIAVAGMLIALGVIVAAAIHG